MPALKIGLWHFFFVWAVTGVKVASNAVFLSREEPGLLPLLYVFVTLGVLLLSTYLAKVLSQHPPALVLRTSMWLGAVIMLVLGAALYLDVPYMSRMTYVLGEIITTACSVLFWARVSDAFSPRSKKLVVGFVSGGGMTGAIVGGLLAHQFAGSTFLILSLMLYFLLPAVALQILKGLRSRSRGLLLKNQRASLKPAVDYMRYRAFPKWLTLLVVGFACLGAVTDFVFRSQSAQLSEIEMASLFGILNAVVGVVVVVFQMSITNRLLQRFGVFIFMAIAPLALGFLAIAHLFAESFGLLIGMKGIEMAAAFSLNPAAIFLLYNPIPENLRSSVRTFIDGAIKKLGIAFGGGVLYWSVGADTNDISALGVVITSFGILIIFPFVHKAYIKALDEKLGLVRRRGVQNYYINPEDAATQRKLYDELASSDARRVVVALQIMKGNSRLSDDQLLNLLVHENKTVRLTVLELVPKERNAALHMLLTDLVHQGSGSPRVQTLRALVKTSPDNVTQVVRPFYHDQEPEVCTTALELALLNNECSEATERFEALLTKRASLTVVWKRALAQLIGALDKEEHDHILLELIDDEDEEVRRLAIKAAGREKQVLYLPKLINALGQRAHRLEAQEALIAFGDVAVPFLADSLDARNVPVPLRIKIPRILERIGSQKALDALLFSNPVDDAELQQRIALRLYRLCFKKPELEVSKQRTDEAIKRRLKSFQYYRFAYEIISKENNEDITLLQRAVTARVVENLRIVFELLSLHRERDRMMLIFRQIIDVRARTVGRVQDALELLDAALVGDPLRVDILSALEDPDHMSRSIGYYVQRLCSSRDPLLRGIAQKTVHHMGPTSPVSQEQLLSVEGYPTIEGEDMSDKILERLFVLENVDLFENVGPDDLVAIAQIAEEVGYDCGDIIYREGQPGDNMYVIIDGEVALERGGISVLNLAAGGSIGQVSLLDRGHRPVTAKVTSPEGARFLVLERKEFMDLVADRLGMMNALFDLLGSRFRLLLERDHALGSSSKTV